MLNSYCLYLPDCIFVFGTFKLKSVAGASPAIFVAVPCTGNSSMVLLEIAAGKT